MILKYLKAYMLRDSINKIYDQKVNCQYTCIMYVVSIYNEY